MIEPAFTITPDEAETIMSGTSTSYTGEAHRWWNEVFFVFERDGRLFEFLYMEPATEMQEGGQEYESDPVPCYEVWAGYRMVPEYRRVKPATDMSDIWDQLYEAGLLNGVPGVDRAMGRDAER